MKRTKNGQIIFDNIKDLNEEINRKYKPKIDAAIREYHETLKVAKREATKDALILLLPIGCTALYEAYGFGEKRQDRFIEYFSTHMECIDKGITEIEQYREWCKEQGYKYFDVVEVEK